MALPTTRTQAPAFSLPNTDEATISLDDFRRPLRAFMVVSESRHTGMNH